MISIHSFSEAKAEVVQRGLLSYGQLFPIVGLGVALWLAQPNHKAPPTLLEGKRPSQGSTEQLGTFVQT